MTESFTRRIVFLEDQEHKMRDLRERFLAIRNRTARTGQPEHEASQPPRKRGRFENERSDSMSQGEGASKQHTGDGESTTPKQKMRRRKRMEGAPRQSGARRASSKRHRAERESWEEDG